MTIPRLSTRLLVPAALGAATLIGFSGGTLLHPGWAGAEDSPSTTTASPADEMAKACAGPHRAPLDDATASKVKSAALEAVPGATVDRVGRDIRSGDGYTAMLTKADGSTRVLVHEDKDFKVTSVDDPAPTPARGPGGFGPGGPGRTPLDDATASKVKSAALEAVPGATVDRVGRDMRSGDGYTAMLTKADGSTRVLVHEDKDFKVTSVDDPAPMPARGPGGFGGPGGPRPDGSTTPTTGSVS